MESWKIALIAADVAIIAVMAVVEILVVRKGYARRKNTMHAEESTKGEA